MNRWRATPMTSFETNFDWSTTLWTIGLGRDGRVHVWAAVPIGKRHMAAMLREIADAIENGNLQQIGPMRTAP